MKLHPNDPVALIAWGIWILLAGGWPALYDIWAGGHNHESMSRRLADLLFSPVTGPFAWGIYAAIPIGFVAHELLLRRL